MSDIIHEAYIEILNEEKKRKKDKASKKLKVAAGIAGGLAGAVLLKKGMPSAKNKYYRVKNTIRDAWLARGTTKVRRGKVTPSEHDINTNIRRTRQTIHS
jgi:hypothetical protein